MKAPLMYKGWLIDTKVLSNGTFYCAHNLATDVFINPLYKTWEQLKSVIDALK